MTGEKLNMFFFHDSSAMDTGKTEAALAFEICGLD